MHGAPLLQLEGAVQSVDRHTFVVTRSSYTGCISAKEVLQVSSEAGHMKILMHSQDHE